MPRRALPSTLAPFAGHPITRTRATADGDTYRRAADTACAMEAELARVRRLAGREPPQAFARTVELAAHALRVTAARYQSPAVEAWRRAAMQELGGLLFVHAGHVDIEIQIGRDLYLAQRRDGFA